MKTKMFMAAFAAMFALAICSCGNKKAATTEENAVEQCEKACCKGEGNCEKKCEGKCEGNCEQKCEGACEKKCEGEKKCESVCEKKCEGEKKCESACQK